MPPIELSPDASSARTPSLVMVGVVGVAAAFLDADKGGPNRNARTCRWPIGHPRDADFRFCGEVVTTATVLGNDGHARMQPYCEGCREKARGSKQAAPFRPALLAFSSNAGPRAIRRSGPTRFGRAAG